MKFHLYHYAIPQLSDSRHYNDPTSSSHRLKNYCYYSYYSWFTSIWANPQSDYQSLHKPIKYVQREFMFYKSSFNVYPHTPEIAWCLNLCMCADENVTIITPTWVAITFIRTQNPSISLKYIHFLILISLCCPHNRSLCARLCLAGLFSASLLPCGQQILLMLNNKHKYECRYTWNGQGKLVYSVCYGNEPNKRATSYGYAHDEFEVCIGEFNYKYHMTL